VTQRPRAAAVVVVLALGVSACGSSPKLDTSSLQDRVQVSGTFGSRPTIRMKTPLEVSRTTSWVATPGKGDPVGPEATAILHLTLTDGRTGKTAISTFDRGRQPLAVKLGDRVFPSLGKALTGKRADSRVVVASTADDAYGDNGAPQIGIKGGDSVVMVADILATDPTSVLTGPSGKAHRAPASAPRLVQKGGDPVGFDVSGLRKPRKLVVVPLRDGTGPVVEDPDRIAVDYLGQVWGAREPFGETYSKEPAIYSIGMSGLIKAWSQALVGLKEGARVLLVCPPKVAYGSTAQPDIPARSTLVYVVDVLGVG
jgi:FKBP-type peptidyl-prolyl cis-trans isomerase